MMRNTIGSVRNLAPSQCPRFDLYQKTNELQLKYIYIYLIKYNVFK